MEQYHHCHGYHTLGNQTYHPSFHPFQYPSHQQSKATAVSKLVNNFEVYYQRLVHCV